MNTTLTKVLWFTAGAVIGVAVTRSYFKTKYERVSQEKIESMKWAFSNLHQSEPVEGDTQADTESAEEPVSIVADIISRNAYSTADNATELVRKEVEGVNRPYVISPDEFSEYDEYETQSLDYYADGVLADNMGNVVEDVDSMVGRESLTHFGEYEDDAVHVRNDALKCDFEILRDLRNYSDVYQSGQRPDDD